MSTRTSRLVAAPITAALLLASVPAEAARLSYDSANRLVRSDDGEVLTSYQYDGAGNLIRTCRIPTTGATTCTRLLIDDQPEHARIVAQLAEGSASPDELYAYGPRGLVAARQGDQALVPMSDHTGSVRGWVDRDSAEVVGRVAYDAYGRTRASVGTTAAIGYTGEWDSSDDALWLRARMYLPQLGRFAQRDTFQGFMVNPSSLNRYTYGENNPLRNVDPSGHFVLEAVLVGLMLGTLVAPIAIGLGDWWGSRSMSPELQEATAEQRQTLLNEAMNEAYARHQAVMTLTDLVTGMPGRAGMATTNSTVRGGGRAHYRSAGFSYYQSQAHAHTVMSTVRYAPLANHTMMARKGSNPIGEFPTRPTTPEPPLNPEHIIHHPDTVDLYRGGSRPPGRIDASTNSEFDPTIYNVDGQGPRSVPYVSTSTNPDIALDYAKNRLLNRESDVAYVHRIRMHHNDTVLDWRTSTKAAESEFRVLYEIPAQAIVESWRVTMPYTGEFHIERVP